MREANPVRFFGAGAGADSVVDDATCEEAAGEAAAGAAAGAGLFISEGALGLADFGFSAFALSLSLGVVRRDRCKFEPCRARRAPGFESSEPEVDGAVEIPSDVDFALDAGATFSDVTLFFIACVGAPNFDDTAVDDAGAEVADATSAALLAVGAVCADVGLERVSWALVCVFS